MNKRISLAALGFLITVTPWSELRAQGTARLRVQVMVVPVVSARSVQEAPVNADPSQDAQFSWSARQQGHVITRKVRVTDLGHAWVNASNPCEPSSTKVPYQPQSTDSCEVTINTVELVTE